MVSFAYLQAQQTLPKADRTQYRCGANLNLYGSAALQGLVTQATAGRYLRLVCLLDETTEGTIQGALEVCLCEDDYPGWLAIADLEQLDIAESPYRAGAFAEAEIKDRVQGAIAFAQAAMAQPNQYLWGGTVGPNYDCSGLVQTAFASVGIWLPRDAYQQEAFTQAIAPSELLPGDLVFFGSPTKATHVGLYLGENAYIHSSGKDQGRNGIGIDRLSSEGDRVSQSYYAQLRGAGRVVACYQPQ
ncbi:C40 family peptidase [Stenomitos frigidus]|uniref:Glycoside hydrolase n=1 Tax=Stenomitos frigidus ULC18 TaxID=2107698 RepID=A0A2T1DTM6_9CYAN|nr:C40 family peptidase [Stenomitos frigidus]PSB23847.1 glycoside hydrolase [Stenomitos frigidus ULC18]